MGAKKGSVHNKERPQSFGLIKLSRPPATADAALGRELQKRGSDGKGGDPKKNADNIEKMTKALDDCLQSLKDIKNNTAAMATKKKDN